MRHQAGIAGLVYVAAAAVENLRLLEAPTLRSGPADVRAAYADEALAAVTTVAGAASLPAYVVFAVALVAWSGARRVAVAGALGAAALAGAALVLTARLVADADPGLSETALTLRLVSAPLAALLLIAVAGAPALARPLRVAALATGALLAVLGPLAAVTQAPALETAAKAAFGLQVLWVAATSLVLLFVRPGVPAVTVVRRAAFALLAIAAGLVGFGMLAAPGATGDFFSWRLAPESLAAFAGGVYLGSAVTYALAIGRPDAEVRGLVLGAAVLSTTVLSITFAHLGPFDFERLAAWAWVVLFAGFAAVTTTLVVALAGTPPEPAETPPEVRVALGIAAAVLAATTAALWIDPTGAELPPLGGRFAGAWVALLATVAASAAVRGGAGETRLAGLALVALPAGAVAAALRTGALDPFVLGASVLLAAIGAATLQLRRARPVTTGLGS